MRDPPLAPGWDAPLRLWAPHVQEGRLPSGPKLKELIRMGVPPPLRPWVWMQLSGAAVRRDQMPPSYFSGLLLVGEAECPYREQIEQVRASTVTGPMR